MSFKDNTQLFLNVLGVHYPAIWSELITHDGKKVGHWIWYVFPTSKAGANDKYQLVVKQSEVQIFFDTLETTRVNDSYTLKELWVLIVSHLREISPLDKGRLGYFLTQFSEELNRRGWLTSEQMTKLWGLTTY